MATATPARNEVQPLEAEADRSSTVGLNVKPLPRLCPHSPMKNNYAGPTGEVN